MSDTTRSDDNDAGRGDFWALYLDHFDDIQAATLETARTHPEFAAVLAAMEPEQLAADQIASRQRLERAMAGDWAPYLEHLREQGLHYAQLGLSFRGWFDLVRSFTSYLTPVIVERHAGDPARLSAALLGQQEFVDRAMAMIGEAYVATKHRIIEERERSLARLHVDAEIEHRRRIELEAENNRIQEANRLKGEFLANMSHELRTPLNAIIGFAELLHDGEVGPLEEQQQEFIGDILTSGRHLLQLINDVLDLSKVESGHMEFRPEPIDLGKLVAEIQGILRTSAAARHIQVESHIDPALGDIVIDPGRLKQILYNYLSNALKFTPEGGRVVIRAVVEGPELFRLEVEDNGIGIAAADVERLFVEFQQLEAGADKRHGGTGLGLALTRRLAEAQAGRVTVRSREGHGSVFGVVLPRKALVAAGTPRSPQRTISPGEWAQRILVIEDEAADAAQIVTTLERAGYGVDLAPTVADALELCASRRYDAITLDLMLPDGSGLDVLRALREDERNRDVSVLVITVVAEPGAVAGFAVQEVLPKPLVGDSLVEALARAGLEPSGSRPVLVVDDDVKARKLMETTLRQLGYGAVCCADGEAALQALGQCRPIAAIVDLLMPGMDGFELIERVRASADHARLPVFVWSVKDLAPDELTRLRSTAQAILAKGSGASDLVEALRPFLPPVVRRREGS